MGKLRALSLGIVKGVQHTIDPRYRKATQLLEQLHCLDCGHGSLSHRRRKPAYENEAKSVLRDAIFQTGSPGSGGFHECTFFYCDDCKNEYLACEGHYDGDSCNGNHEEVQKQSELKGCSI